MFCKYYCLREINRSGYLAEHDVARGILKFQCKTWEFRATSCSRHPNIFIDFYLSVRKRNLQYFFKVLTAIHGKYYLNFLFAPI